MCGAGLVKRVWAENDMADAVLAWYAQKFLKMGKPKEVEGFRVGRNSVWTEMLIFGKQSPPPANSSNGDPMRRNGVGFQLVAFRSPPPRAAWNPENPVDESPPPPPSFLDSRGPRWSYKERGWGINHTFI